MAELFKGDVSTWGAVEWGIIGALSLVFLGLLIAAIVLGSLYSQQKKKNEENQYAPLQSPRQAVPPLEPDPASSPYGVMEPEQMKQYLRSNAQQQQQQQQRAGGAPGSAIGGIEGDGTRQRRPIFYEELPPSAAIGASLQQQWARAPLPPTPLPPRSAVAGNPIVYGRLPRQPSVQQQQAPPAQQQAASPFDWMNVRSPEEDLYSEVDMDLE